jgi:hypothetical protein
MLNRFLSRRILRLALGFSADQVGLSQWLLLSREPTITGAFQF